MKKLLFSILISASATVFAQNSSKLVVADGMLAGSTFLKTNAKNIKSQKTYIAKAALPNDLKAFSGSSDNGLISIVLKDNYYDKITLSALNVQNELSAESPVLFDGILVKNTDIIILGDVINKTEVKIVDGKKILSISSAPKS